MSDSDPAPPPSPPVSAAATLSPTTVNFDKKKQDDLQPVAAKVAELNESQSELLARLQGLKQDLQSWRTKLDTQVKTYKDELSELKSRLNTDVEALTSLNEDAESQAISDGNGKDGKEKPKDSSQDGSKEIKPSDDAAGNLPEGK
ncbi:uncharacterized protein LOC141840902 isoform X5 [Curcuma longa]|uniref:uncharacterized protein LOC141840902 isoform X5 n=1 Tax=Curcuma longa TaxID=136217 RepID=UPI003D9F034A